MLGVVRRCLGASGSARPAVIILQACVGRWSQTWCSFIHTACRYRSLDCTILRTATRIWLLDNLALLWNKSCAWAVIHVEQMTRAPALVNGLVLVLWWAVLDNEPALSNIVHIACNCLPRSSLCLCEAQGREGWTHKHFGSKISKTKHSKSKKY